MRTNSSLNNPAASFITRWKASGASEPANYQLFLSELCELLGIEKPRPASDKVEEADYTFERPVEFNDGEGKNSTLKTGIGVSWDHSSIHSPIFAAGYQPSVCRSQKGGECCPGTADRAFAGNDLWAWFTEEDGVYVR